MSALATSRQRQVHTGPFQLVTRSTRAGGPSSRSTCACVHPGCTRLKFSIVKVGALAQAASSKAAARTMKRMTADPAASGARGLALGLEHLALDAIALERREVLDEHLATQMIHLVLDAHGQDALGLDRARLAVLVLRRDLHARGALDAVVDAGH